MRNLTLLFLLVTTSFIACTNTNEAQYHLSGKIDGLNNKKLYLEHMSFDKNVSIDTTTTDAEGNYLFEGKIDEPGFYRIVSEGKNQWMLRLDNEEIVLNADSKDQFPTKVEVLESENAKEFQSAVAIFASKQAEIQKLSQEYQTKSMASAPVAEIKEVENRYNKVQEELKEEIKTKIESTSDPLTAYFLMSALPNFGEMDYLKEKITEFEKLNPNSSYLSQLKEQVQKIEDQKAAQEAKIAASQKVSIGAEALDFTQKNPKGEDLTFSDLKGKVVLLDFWASWCKPCRQENPNVVAAYNKFKDQGFTVFSVSLDKDRQAWLDAIKADRLIWNTHTSDLQFWNNAVAQLYGVQSIPAAFLIDREGKIVATNLRGAELEEKIKEIIK